ncbi:leucyl aminopeptidase [Mesobaculum littorinae]|uniref:Probable cytosol aminopeptidase n=1 Tax=Mesobaculum littorinae TaxID=2486419 RepID=A0A438AK13_9RHOB|nr:leucyl aminopeptidase [Mesobaculum littorinae]RVV98937.1 leucyl aminopeptidase [Mesobaculum littorinae]
MTTPASVSFRPFDPAELAQIEGRIVVFADADGTLDPAARRIDRLTRGAVKRAVEGEAFEDATPGTSVDLAFPAGLAAEAVQVICLPRRPTAAEARKAGVAVGRSAGSAAVTLLANARRFADELALGAVLRGYTYRAQRTGAAADKTAGPVAVLVSKPGDYEDAADRIAALAQGVFFTRDLTAAPSNVLTTTEFARQLEGLRDLGVEVEVLEEAELEELGMRTLLAVGQGSESPSKVVVMQWKGAGGDPLALVGKGVVFDAGGISLKPAAGMEDMTMDMGGAGVVSGVMKTLALRKAKAHVVGLVGLVENMPDGRATRPGDVVRSMKGDTVEVINTDAEGRMVLADVLWYAQERFKPQGVVDLATLTGAIMIGLGHENAGVFSNNDPLCDAFLKAAKAEGEGAWRMPLGEAYAKQLKSDVADVKNVGGRPGGAITAAEFLRRFVKDDTPWIHLDIAGVAKTGGDSAHAGKGVSGWGVLSLDRLVRDRFEGE